MFPTPDSDGVREDEVLAERVEALAAWLQDLDARVGATEVATGDEKTAKELRKAIEALAKHDPKLEARLTDRVDVVNDRLAMLAETIATTSAGSAAKEGELVGLRRAIEAERAKIEALTAELRDAPTAGGIDELRRKVAALAAERPQTGGDTRELEGKVTAVGQRVEMLHETVSTTAAGLASRDGELAAIRRQLEEDVRAIESTVAELRIDRDPVHVAELRLQVKELSEQATALERRSGQGLQALQSVVGRLEALSQAVAGTGESVASGERELGALRSVLDEETGRLDSQVARVEQALGAVSSQLEALGNVPDRASVEAVEQRTRSLTEALEALSGSFQEERVGMARLLAEVRSEVQTLAEAAPGEELETRLSGELERALGAQAEERETLAAGSRLLEERVQSFAETLDSVSGRVASLSQAVEETGQGYVERQDEVRALARRFEEGRGQVDALIGDLRSALETMPAPDPTLPGRVQDLSEQLEGIGARLQELDAASAGAQDEARAEASGVRAELTRGLEEVASKIEAVEQERAAVAHELERALGAQAEERETLAAGSRLLEERVQSFAETLDSVSGRVASLSQAVEETGQGYVERQDEVRALARRFEEGRGQVDALIGDLRSALETMPAPDPTLPGRVQDLSEQLEGIGARLQELDAASAGAQDEARAEASGVRAELTRGLEEVASKIEAVEQERAAVAHELERALEAQAEERETLAAGSRLLEERVQSFAETLDSVSGRVASLSQAVAGTGEAVASGERELGALRSVLDEETGRLDSQVARVEQALGAVSSQLEALGNVPDRASVEAVEQRTRSLTEALEALSGSFQEERAGVARVLAEVRSEVQTLAEAAPGEELEARLSGELERALGAQAEERETLAAGSRLLEERVQSFAETLDSVSGRVASLSQAVEETGQGYVELGALRGSFDEETGRLDSHVTKIEQALAAMTSRLDLLETSFGPDPATATRLEVLSQAVEAQAASVAAATGGVESGEQELTALRAQLTQGEARLDAVAAGLRGAMDALAVQLDGLAESVESRASAREAKDAELAALDDRVARESGRLDAFAGDLRDALAAMAAQAPDPDSAERYEALERRLDTVAADFESRSAGKETDVLLGRLLLRVDDVAGRLDRLEEVETAGRESRESVLMQLERLASRVEWRLDRLESGPTGAAQPQAEGTHGRLVPIRGNEA